MIPIGSSDDSIICSMMPLNTLLLASQLLGMFKGKLFLSPYYEHLNRDSWKYL